MVKSVQVFRTTDKLACVALVMAYVGLGLSQMNQMPNLMSVPPLRDPMTMLENQLMTPTSNFFAQTHNVQQMSCFDNRFGEDSVVTLIQVGTSTVIRSLEVSTVQPSNGEY